MGSDQVTDMAAEQLRSENAELRQRNDGLVRENFELRQSNEALSRQLTLLGATPVVAIARQPAKPSSAADEQVVYMSTDKSEKPPIPPDRSASKRGPSSLGSALDGNKRMPLAVRGYTAAGLAEAATDERSSDLEVSVSDTTQHCQEAAAGGGR